MNQMKPNTLRAPVIASLALSLCLLASSSRAAPRDSSITITPTVTNITLVNGQLFASGFATASIHGRVVTAPFSGVPVNLGLAPNQTNSVGCPVLNLSLGPINLDLLGVVVQTSPICLDITALPGGGLLGNLLCNVSTLLGQGLTLSQILATLNTADLHLLTTALTDVINGVLSNLLQSVLQGITGTGPGQCPILNLTLGPLDLNLLGLNVHLDNCSNGPVTVTVSAHRGALLGNLLCSLTGRGQLQIGALLSDILNELLNSGPL